MLALDFVFIGHGLSLSLLLTPPRQSGGRMSEMYLCRDINGDAHLVAAAQLVQRTSVYVIAIRDNTVLLVLDGTGHAGMWDLPGGGVEEGEDRLDALERELLEETGL